MITLETLKEFEKAYPITWTIDEGPDHWQTPKETEERGMGDCEDIAIHKMFHPDFKELPAICRRIAYVIHPEFGPHMICLLFTRHEDFVLDNTNPPIALKDSIYQSNNAPIYELDADGVLYFGGKPLESHPGVKLFNTLLQKMQKGG